MNEIKDEFYTLPKAMYSLSCVKSLLINDNNCILFKELTQSSLDMQKVIVSHSIVYVISGSVKIITPKYEEFSVNAGEMIFMPKDSYLISDYVKDHQNMKVYLFFFDHNIVNTYLKLLNTKITASTSKILKLNTSVNLLNYLSSLENVNYKNKMDSFLLQTKIFELFHLISECNQEFAQVLEALDKQITDIQTYMLNHYDKNLSVQDWANLSGQSVSTFIRKFKRNYQLTPKRWLSRQNMNLAKKALAEGKSVSECSLEFGYANASNFIKAYKEIHNITPKQHSLN